MKERGRERIKSVCVCVCVCLRERDREREREDKDVSEDSFMLFLFISLALPSHLSLSNPPLSLFLCLTKVEGARRHHVGDVPACHGTSAQGQSMAEERKKKTEEKGK